ncbi:MAG: VOC family protein [Candidatus Tectimicrobiota bacterium]
MFDKIQHIGYLVDNLDSALAWFKQSFGGERAAGGALQHSRVVPSGGRNAFVHFGQVEVELIEPADTSALPANALVMHHVGYAVADIPRAVAWAQARGFGFLEAAPYTNPLGQQVLYFDPATTHGVLIHLTQLPAQPNMVGVGAGLQIEQIIHAGYLVRDVTAAVAWYVEKFDGVHAGGGVSRRGGRNAFVNFGRVQVELIEPQDPSAMGAQHEMDHVGYVTRDIGSEMATCSCRGLQFAAEAPNTNSIGQQVLYFDTKTSLGSRMHLTQLPA